MNHRFFQVAAVWAFSIAGLFETSQTLGSPADRVLPTKPALAKVSAVSLIEIDLTWRDRSTNEDGFQIERSTDNLNFRQIAQVLPNTTIYRDKGLFPGTKYFYRIRAFSEAGESGYSSESARTPSPPVPLTIATWYDTPASGTNAPDCVSLAAGSDHVLELKKDGTVTAWGDNTYGQTVVPPDLTGVVSIAAGYVQSLALKDGGTVVGWGETNAATPPEGLSGVVAISAGASHSLALKGDGTVVGWGDNSLGQATPPTNLTGVVAIAAGLDHSLALKSDGTIVGWGNFVGGITTAPTNLTSAVAIAAGPNRSFAVTSNGAVVGWGDNSFGAAAPPTNLTGVVSIAAAWNYTVALKDDGTLIDWGQKSPLGAEFLLPDLGGAAVSVSALGYRGAALSLAPASPSDMSAVVLASNRARLSWRDNSVREQGFRIERIGPNATFPLAWTEIAVVGPNKTNYVDSTLTTNGGYTYRVRAYNHFGTSPYAVPVNVVTVPLFAPFLISAALGTNEVDIAWGIGYDGIDGFKIERAVDDNGIPSAWTEIASTNVTSPGTYHFIDTNIQTNTIYWYRVRAFNSLGLSPYTDSLSVAVVPPPTPFNFFANVSLNAVTLTWVDNGVLIDGFKIERAADAGGVPGSWTQIAVAGPGANSYLDGGLSANTTNWYRIRAFNWVGDSFYTDPISAIISPTPPPFSLSVSMGLETNTAQVTWGFDGVEDKFELERAPDVQGNPGTWAQIAVLNDTNVSSDSFTDTNVLANSTNWYRVRAFSIMGYSDYTTPVSLRTLPPSDVPADLPLLATNGVRLFWLSDPNKQVGFGIERAPDASGAPGTWTEIGILNVSNYDDVSFIDTNVVADTTNWYRIRAFNWAGSTDYGSPASIGLLPPETPVLPFAAPSLDSISIEISWVAALGEATSFEIQRAPDLSGSPGLWTTIVTKSGFVTDYTDSGVISNSTYWYQVRAVTWVGDSPYSTAVSATAPTAAAELP